MIGITKTSAVLVSLVLSLTVFTTPVDSSPEAITAEIDLQSQVNVVPNQSNETTVSISGTFYIETKSGVDQADTDASLSVSGGPWTANINPRSFQSVEKQVFYDFTVTVVVPQDANAGESGSYTVEIVFSNLFGSSDPETAPLRITLEEGPQVGDDDGNGGNATVPQTPKSFPYWLIFLGGIVILVAIGVVWAVRNLEIVRETSGDRRIMLREKDSGKVFDRRKRD